MGAEVAIVEGADRLLAREPAALGDALPRRCGPTASSCTSGATRAPPAATPTTGTSSSSTTAASARRPPARRDRAPAAHRWPRPRDRRARARPRRDRRRRADARGRGRLGDRRRHRHLAADLGRQVPGRGSRRRTSSAMTARPTTPPCPRVVFTDPQMAAVGEADGPVTATCPLPRSPAQRRTRGAYDTRPGFPGRSSRTASGSPAPTPPAPRRASGCSRRRWRPNRVPLSVLLRRHPAVPDVLRGVPPRAAGARGTRAGGRGVTSLDRPGPASAPAGAAGREGRPRARGDVACRG